MDTITWGTTRTEAGDTRCTIFCHACREVFARDLSVVDAVLLKPEIRHECKKEAA